MDISELLNLSISAALDSGKEIMKIYKSENFDVEFKTDKSPLTLADITSNRIINNKLKKSKYLILSEEGKNISFSERKDKKKIWIVDPIDGTKEFIKKNDEFTVNIALVENGKPIIGVVFAPALKELYFAAKTIGSFKVKNVTDLRSLKENSKLNLKDLKTPEKYTLITSRSHLDFETKKFINKMKKKYDNIILKSFGSSIKICSAAWFISFS